MKLKCLKVETYNRLQLYPTEMSLSSACSDNFEQLSLVSKHTVIPDEFMEPMSAHGGLVNVYLNVSTITGEGVRILLENSPKLMQLMILITASYMLAKPQY